MRILVIGNNGQVATALSYFSNQEAEVIRIGRPDIDLATPKNFTKIFLKFSPDVIVNPAAYTAVEKSENDPERVFAINATGAGVVAAAAAEIGIPYIYVSTDYVFDGSACVPVREDADTAPLNVYGKSKLAGERNVISFTNNYVILRTAWVYSMIGRNFLCSILEAAKVRHELDVVCDQFGTPTSAFQIAISILKIARNLVDNSDIALRGVFHMVANGGPISWADFAEHIFLISAKYSGPVAEVRRVSTRFYPTTVRRPMYSCLDCSKLEKIHNIRISSWKDGLYNVFSHNFNNTKVILEKNFIRSSK
ncbi:dTDP-4-dehydrorhamnose reductase [Candidatus Liberibacter sp.]|uniref:dTDP-4-dehydrorhamnose reductase n=1 Tax=Candidatus Liberibacter sp. TaxID=34022 RepID=UPI0015F723D7|nr:dTDP-4-dehydrorhamnose reductase [Candidatus Liberibacter sp.]MBA5723737.1 dTDP-4-dehydrorhamnose reductase [Candidatus Liberibacter sp.]